MGYMNAAAGNLLLFCFEGRAGDFSHSVLILSAPVSTGASLFEKK